MKKSVLIVGTVLCILICLILVSCVKSNVSELKFNVDGEIFHTLSAESGATISLPTTPTKTGYNFEGWFFDNTTFNQQLTINSLQQVSSASTLTVYAKWALHRYNITYNLDGGINHIGNPDSFTIEDNNITLYAPTKIGYIFSGWFEADLLTEADTVIESGSTGDCIFYAKWQTAQNAITFDSNGGVGAMSPLSLHTATSGSLPQNTFTRAGYAFSGWAESADGVAVYADKATYVMGTAAKTIYAVWTPNENTLIFDSNGGVGAMANLTADSGESMILPQNTFTKIGYYFGGWATSNSGAAVYTNSGNYIMGTDASNTLYAAWVPNQNLLVFNRNGGTGTMADMRIATGAIVELSKNSFEKENNTFIGWAASSNGAVVYIDEDTYVMGIGATNVLYAVWQITSAIIFNANGGTGAMNNVPITIGESCTLTENTYVRAGYTFDGWATTASGAAEYLDKGAFTMASENSIILYAKWLANSNKLSFNANGGTGIMEDRFVNSNDSLILPTNAFTYIGYAFIGWATSASGSVVYNNEATYIMGISAITILYAKWEMMKTLNFNSNGGSGSMGTVKAKSGTTFDLPENTFTKQGYTFDGWSMVVNGSILYNDKAAYTMGQNSSYTLYAVWAAIANNVIFNANGGEGTMDSITIRTNSSASLPVNSFTRSGYAFSGWSLTAGGSVGFSNGDTYIMGSNANTVLYAVWNLIIYNINYNLYSGNNSTNNPSTYSVISEAIEIESPTKTGYTFKGWYASDLSTPAVTSIASGSIGNKAYYAVWEIIEYTIEYVLADGINAAGNPAKYTIEDSFTLSAPTKAGYAFVNWCEADLV
ncbi:MAG: hypothetical protein EOM87_01700, partial [Clostridia bacterium]|nr:hypothetical protein [Clostridia bacterium]